MFYVGCYNRCCTELLKAGQASCWIIVAGKYARRRPLDSLHESVLEIVGESINEGHTCSIEEVFDWVNQRLSKGAIRAWGIWFRQPIQG